MRKENPVVGYLDEHPLARVLAMAAESGLELPMFVAFVSGCGSSMSYWRFFEGVVDKRGSVDGELLAEHGGGLGRTVFPAWAMVVDGQGRSVKLDLDLGGVMAAMGSSGS